MANYFPPTPVYPKGYDSDHTLYLVYNTSETITTEKNNPWASEISIKPVSPDSDEIWAKNGYANIGGELFYYDDVGYDAHEKINKFKRCARNLGGVHTKLNLVGTEVRGFVIAEHHNQLVDAIVNIEKFVGENFSTDKSTLDFRIRHLQQLPTIFDDYTCPDVNFNFYIESSNPATGIVAVYDIIIDGSFTSYRLDFGDGEFTTTSTTGTHRYALNSTIDPVLTISNSKCVIVQTPIARKIATEPPTSTNTTAFEINIPNIPNIPQIVIPTPPPISTIVNPPPIVFPCLDIGPIGPINIPSVIQIDPPINIPSSISFSPLDIPSTISITPVTLPSTISITPVNLPSLITITPVSLPSVITIVAPTIPNINITPPTIPNITITPPTIPNITITPPTIPNITITPPTIPNITITPPTIPNITITPPTIPNITITPPTIPNITITPPTIPNITITPPTIPNITITPPTIPDITITPPTIPNITITPPTIPNITITPPTFPNITITPPTIPNITITPPTFPNITITPPTIPNINVNVPDFPPVTFGQPPAFPAIQFGKAPSVPVSWGTPPECKCTVTVSCPGGGAFTNPNALDGLPEADPIEVQVGDIGIPSEIKLVVPEIPDIRVLHDIPAIIRVEVPKIPDIKILVPSNLPSEIRLVADNIPSSIELVSTNIPKSISIDSSNLPSSIKLELADNLPTLKVEMIDKIQVIGMPSTIELVGPSEIKLVLPDRPEIELVYKGAPIDVKINLDISRLTGEDGNSQCVAIVPCNK